MAYYAGTSDRDSPLLFVGISPAKTPRLSSSSSFARLKRWCLEAGIESWDFHNLIPHVPGSEDPRDILEAELLERVRGKEMVVALGTFVHAQLRRRGIDSIRIDHPSPRNRNFNDPSHEGKVVIPTLRMVRECLSS
jgi:hypothetical protein